MERVAPRRAAQVRRQPGGGVVSLRFWKADRRDGEGREGVEGVENEGKERREIKAERERGEVPKGMRGSSFRRRVSF